MQAASERGPCSHRAAFLPGHGGDWGTSSRSSCCLQGGEVESPLAPCCAEIGPALPSPMLPSGFDTCCRPRWLGSRQPPASHHPHIALGVLLQKMGRLGVNPTLVQGNSGHNAGTKTPTVRHAAASPALGSALHPSPAQIRAGWGAGRDAAVDGGPGGRSPGSIATGTCHVMESFPLGLRSRQPYSHGHK